MRSGELAKKVTSKKKKTSSSPRKKSNRTKKKVINWKKSRDIFFQRIGIITTFGIIVLVLLTIILSLFQNRGGEGEVIDSGGSEDISQATRQAFVNRIAPIAKKLQGQYGIFASVSMAQAMIESDFGQSGLSANYNNLYGVKTDRDDPNGVDLKTLEYEDDEWIEITDRFKVYSSWEESMTAHAQLMVNGVSWNPDYYKAVTDGKTPAQQAQGLQTAGYATDPNYADKLIQMMDEWNLYQYNQVETATTISTSSDAIQEEETSQ